MVGQADYPSWWPSLTKKLQTEHNIIRRGETRARVHVEGPFYIKDL